MKALLLLMTMSTLFADQQHLEQLRSFLNNTAERTAYANQKADSKQSNDFLMAFPEWAQKEILEIIMLIMAEQGKDPMSYDQTAKNQGYQAAAKQFSPQVQARVEALTKKLSSDPSFNTPKNLNQMQQKMPNR